MHIIVCFFWRLHLDDEVDRRNVQASRCDIGGDETLDDALLEILENVLPVALGDVAVERAFLLWELESHIQVIYLSLCLAKDNDTAVGSCIDTYQVRDGLLQISFISVHAQTEMLDSSRCLYFKLLYEVHKFAIFTHEFASKLLHPSRHSRRKQQFLRPEGTTLAHNFQDLLHCLLEALLHHLISLVQTDTLKLGQIDSVSLQ